MPVSRGGKLLHEIKIFHEGVVVLLPLEVGDARCYNVYPRVIYPASPQTRRGSLIALPQNEFDSNIQIIIGIPPYAFRPLYYSGQQHVRVMATDEVVRCCEAPCSVRLFASPRLTFPNSD